MTTTWTFWAIAFRKPRMSWMDATTTAKSATVNAFLALLVLAHIPLAEKFVEVFECATDVDRSYMVAQPDITCYTAEWYSARKAAIAGCVFYAAGIPVVVVLLSIKYRKRLNDNLVVQRYGILFDLYNDSAWWFETYRSCMSLVLMVVPVTLADYPLFISVINLIIFNADGFIVKRFRPYRFQHVNNIYGFVVWTWNITTFVGILYFSNSLSASQSDIVGVWATICIFATVVISVHSVVYEWQLLLWERFNTFKVTSRIVSTPIYARLFPYHLNKQGQKLVRQIEKLPDTSGTDERAGYPREFYERATGHRTGSVMLHPPGPGMKHKSSEDGTPCDNIIKTQEMEGLHRRASVADFSRLEDGDSPPMEPFA
ncbi:hypothetical protein HKX48_000698 [Thoreauomyces humboldtii]|nr:hypothetical protein HKX48_000698 [Thoreauomyces humboldtii]